MFSLLLIMIVSLLLAIRGGGLAADEAVGPAGGLGHWFRAEVRKLEHQRDGMAHELSTLPQPAAAPTSARLGWHTKVLHSSGETVWVQVDLLPMHRRHSVVEMRADVKAVMAEATQLDAIMHNKYARNPDKLRAWDSASHIECAPKREKKRTPAPPPHRPRRRSKARSTPAQRCDAPRSGAPADE